MDVADGGSWRRIAESSGFHSETGKSPWLFCLLQKVNPRRRIAKVLKEE
jgi:hypothetical protein